MIWETRKMVAEIETIKGVNRVEVRDCEVDHDTNILYIQIQYSGDPLWLRGFDKTRTLNAAERDLCELTKLELSARRDPRGGSLGALSLMTCAVIARIRQKMEGLGWQVCDNMECG